MYIHKVRASGVVGTHRGVVMSVEVLQGFHEPATHVAGLGSLHGCVHQALAPSHGVEEELRRRQAAVEAGRHKPLALRRPGVMQRLRSTPRDIYKATYNLKELLNKEVLVRATLSARQVLLQVSECQMIFSVAASGLSPAILRKNIYLSVSSASVV